MPLAEQQQSQSSALGNFIDQLRPMRVLQNTYVNTLPPSLQSEEYAYNLLILLLRIYVMLWILLSLS